MRRFRFRFQRVLELKERLEDVRKAALGEAVGACESERRELERLQQDRQQTVAAERPAHGRVDPGLLSLLADYGQRLEREAGSQGEQVRLAESVVEEKRGDLLEATRERRVFEVLQEREQAAHRKTVRRQELIGLDEVGGQLHLRRQRDEQARDEQARDEQARDEQARDEQARDEQSRTDPPASGSRHTGRGSARGDEEATREWR